MAATRKKGGKSVQLGIYITEERWVWLEAMALRDVFSSKNTAVNAALDMLEGEVPPAFYVPRVAATHRKVSGWRKAAQWLLLRLYRVTDWLEDRVSGVSRKPETPPGES